MTSLRLLLTVAGSLIVVACQSSLQQRGSDFGRTPVQKEIREAGREWDGLFNSGDSTKLSALYAENAISMPPNSPTVSGRKALEAEFASFFAANVARHETMVDQILEQGDLAIEVARYRLTFKPRAGGPEVVETGRHVEIRQRFDGQWRIVLEIWNSDMPASK